MGQPLLARPVHKHQHLPRADHGVVSGLVTVEDGHAARVDIETLAESIADLAHGGVPDGQTFEIGPDRDRHEPGGLMGFGEKMAKATSKAGRFTLVLVLVLG